MAKRLTFFESIFLNRHFKEMKLAEPKIQEEVENSPILETFESNNFFKADSEIENIDITNTVEDLTLVSETTSLNDISDSEVAEQVESPEFDKALEFEDNDTIDEAEESDFDFATLDINTDDVSSDFDTDLDVDLNVDSDLDNNSTENKFGIILLEKTYDDSLYEEDDDYDFDDLGNTKVFMNSLSKTLKFKSNINFDEDTSDYNDDFDLDEFDLDIDLDDDFDYDYSDEFTEELDEELDNSLEKEVDIEEVDNVLSNILEKVSSSVEESTAKTKEFELGSGVMHFDLDDQLDITDIEGSSFDVNEFIDSSYDEDEDVKIFGFGEDKKNDSDLSSDETESNFPVLGSLSTLDTEEAHVPNSDVDDEVNIPLL